MADILVERNFTSGRTIFAQFSDRLVFRCLLCSDDKLFINSADSHSHHPIQPLVSDELLEAQAFYHQTGEFSCPHCDIVQLNISDLYEHLILEHLDNLGPVRCPVCVCFGGNASLVENIHLSEHIATNHCTSWEQYREKIVSCGNESDDLALFKYNIANLPFTYCGMTSSSTGSSTSAAYSANPEASDESIETDQSRIICVEPTSDFNSDRRSCGHMTQSQKHTDSPFSQILNRIFRTVQDGKSYDSIGTETAAEVFEDSDELGEDFEFLSCDESESENENEMISAMKRISGGLCNQANITCVICMEPVLDASRRRLPCAHSFHSECIDNWVREEATCPLCRKQIS
ncbi:E3 ubiquitin-protein ligase KCMF1-like [Topomyia yanbarensis]|uniref:E3 ubiquitin-protein ligase KCMF1-like n=1 Tax=Topomyia yanbarensis TaxID=2498891 RepID=UPI00273B57CF|nr:E3 ubiquitin-protein ligase KCMF1-like [Topomyia yanbarensis]